MKTEEIEKAGWEYAKRSIDETTEIPNCIEQIRASAVTDFMEGAEWMNKHWENRVKENSIDMNTNISINDYVNIKLKGHSINILGQVTSVRFDQYTVLTPFGKMTVPLSNLEKSSFIQDAINKLLKY